MAQSLAARTGLYANPEESQYELIRRLQGEGVLPKEVKQVLDQIRVTGNVATCHRTLARAARQLGGPTVKHLTAKTALAACL